MRENYRTKQGDEILKILRESRGEHMTASRLVETLAGQGHPVAVATVYRRLDKLVAEGVVKKYYLGSGTGACYEYIGAKDECLSHFHCQCEQCGQLIHMDCDELIEIRKHLINEHGFAWDSGRTVFYGICDQCRRA